MTGRIHANDLSQQFNNAAKKVETYLNDYNLQLEDGPQVTPAQKQILSFCTLLATQYSKADLEKDNEQRNPSAIAKRFFKTRKHRDTILKVVRNYWHAILGKAARNRNGNSKNNYGQWSEPETSGIQKDHEHLMFEFLKAIKIAFIEAGDLIHEDETNANNNNQQKVVSTVWSYLAFIEVMAGLPMFDSIASLNNDIQASKTLTDLDYDTFSKEKGLSEPQQTATALAKIVKYLPDWGIILQRDAEQALNTIKPWKTPDILRLANMMRVMHHHYREEAKDLGAEGFNIILDPMALSNPAFEEATFDQYKALALSGHTNMIDTLKNKINNLLKEKNNFQAQTLLKYSILSCDPQMLHDITLDANNIHQLLKNESENYTGTRWENHTTTRIHNKNKTKTNWTNLILQTDNFNMLIQFSALKNLNVGAHKTSNLTRFQSHNFFCSAVSGGFFSFGSVLVVSAIGTGGLSIIFTAGAAVLTVASLLIIEPKSSDNLSPKLLEYGSQNLYTIFDKLGLFANEQLKNETAYEFKYNKQTLKMNQSSLFAQVHNTIQKSSGKEESYKWDEAYLKNFVDHAIKKNSLNKLLFAFENLNEINLELENLNDVTLKNHLSFAAFILDNTTPKGEISIDALLEKIPTEFTVTLDDVNYLSVLAKLKNELTVDAVENTNANNNNNNNNNIDSGGYSLTIATRLIDETLINYLSKGIKHAKHKTLEWDTSEPVLQFLLQARADLASNDNTLNIPLPTL